MSQKQPDRFLEGVQIMRDFPDGRRTKGRIEEDKSIKEWLQSLLDDPETHVFIKCRDLRHPGKRVEKMWGTPTFHRRRVVCDCGYSYEQNVHNGQVVWKGNQSYPTGYNKPPEGPAGYMNSNLWRHMQALLQEFDSNIPPDVLLLLEEMGRN